ncbi:hypothetical protein ABIE33_006257 [Ensifer sp. 4252]
MNLLVVVGMPQHPGNGGGRCRKRSGMIGSVRLMRWQALYPKAVR